MVLMVVYVSLRLVRYTWRPMATLLCAVGTTMASSIVWWVLAGEGRLVFAVQALMNVLLTLYLMVYLREFFELQSDNYGVGKYEMDRLHANKLIDYYTIPFWALIRVPARVCVVARPPVGTRPNRGHRGVRTRDDCGWPGVRGGDFVGCGGSPAIKVCIFIVVVVVTHPLHLNT
jgi:hypothetical protein